MDSPLKRNSVAIVLMRGDIVQRKFSLFLLLIVGSRESQGPHVDLNIIYSVTATALSEKFRARALAVINCSCLVLRPTKFYSRQICWITQRFPTNFVVMNKDRLSQSIKNICRLQINYGGGFSNLAPTHLVLNTQYLV